MKAFNRIDLGTLVKIQVEGVAKEGRVIGLSQDFNDKIELRVEILETREEYSRMQSEVTYID